MVVLTPETRSQREVTGETHTEVPEVPPKVRGGFTRDSRDLW